MRKLSAFPDQRAAQALSALLEVNDVPNEVRDVPDGFSVWVHDDTDLPAAKELLAHFDLESSERLVEEAEKRRQEKQRAARPLGVARQVRTAPTTPLGLGVILLIAACVLAAFLGQLDWMPSLSIAPIDPERGFFGRQIAWSQPWRLITPIFMHLGLFHILFNMIWLRRLGGQVEQNHGTVGFGLLVLVSAATSNLAQYYLRGPFFGGMSGVNYALFGFGWIHTRYGTRGYAVTQTDAFWLMGWLVVCAAGLVGPVANAAHAVGLICGVSAGAPAYFRFRRAYKVKTGFEKGSWEDLNIKGFQRFRRLYLEPYMPGWVLLLALFVLWLDT